MAIYHEHQSSTADSQIKKIFAKYAGDNYASMGKAGLKRDDEEEENGDEISEASIKNKWLSKAATRDAAQELIDSWDLALTAEEEELFKEKHFEAAWAQFMTGGRLQFKDTREFVNYLLEKHPIKPVSVDKE